MADAEPTNINSEQSQNSPDKKSGGTFFRRIGFILGVLILLIFAVIIFIQTDFFNKHALDYALDFVNKDLEKKQSKVIVESLEGNILSGIELKNTSVIVKEDTLLKFNSLKLDYNILRLLSKEIIADEVILDQPRINITKVTGSNDSLVWNFEHLLESEKDEDTTTSEFDWGITARKVQIRNGSLRIIENKPEGVSINDVIMPKLDTFGVSNLDVTELNLDLSGNYFPNRKDAMINNLSFKTNSDFNVDSLHLEAEINETDEIATIRNFELLTDRSDIAINFIRMTEFSLEKGIDYEEFDNNMTQIDLNFRKVNFEDLKFFLPDLSFLDSVVSLKLFAEGDYADLNINSLEVKLPNSSLTFSGRIKNLDEPSKLYFDIAGKDLSIDPADTRRVIPGLDVPDYSHVGVVYVPYAKYKGEPSNFDAEIDFRSSVGNINGSGSLDASGDVSIYKGDFEVSRVNLGKFFKDSKLESDITGEFKTAGKGFDYKTMSGFLDYRIRSTKFYGQSIKNSEGRLDFNRGDVKLGINYASSTLDTKFSGKINVSNIDNISYNLKGTASGLDISSFTKDNSQKSNLNFNFDVNGRGFDPDKLAGNYKIDMRQSTFAGIEIPAGNIDLESGSGNMKKIDLLNDFADIEIDGNFGFSQIAESLQRNIESLMIAFEKDETPDTTFLLTVPLSSSGCNEFYLNYKLNIKNPNAIKSYLDSIDVIVKGFLTGHISDSCGMFTLNTEGYLQDLNFTDSSIAADTLPLNFLIRNNTALPGLQGFYADMNLRAPSMFFSGFRVDSVDAELFIIDGKDSIALTAHKDSVLKLFTVLSIKDSMIATFDTLVLQHKDFSLSNNKDLSIQYVSNDSIEGINFRTFSITSLGQRLSVDGFYSIKDSSSLKLTGKNLKVETYSLLLGNQVVDSTNTLLGNIRNLEIDFNGTLRDPYFKIIAISDILRYGSTRIGRLDANLSYENDNAVSDITFTNINNTGDFSIKGNLPMILTFEDDTTNLKERREVFLDKDVNLSAVADNFQIKVFQQLLPYTKGFEGTLDGSISILGKAEKPNLSGNMRVDSGKISVTLTKMKYSFDANVETNNEKLIIKNSHLFSAEEPSRFISASGYVDLTGLKLNDIRLDMTGDIKAFDKDNGTTELGIAGDLWVGSGKPGLLLTGREGRFDLTGNLLLVKGNVSFNPFIQEAYKIYDDDFSYGVIIDSVLKEGQVVNRVLKERKDSMLVLTNLNLNPFEKVLYISTNTAPIKKIAREKSGAFIYNVYVTTSDNVFLRFIVNERSQQEFFGEIKTDLYVDNRETNIAARGTVTLGNNCYYRFFRKFDATGKVVFNGPVTNPELDIEANYKGVVSENASGIQSFFDEVLIYLAVTGPAMNPKIDISLERFGTKETGQNAASDAISYLLFGKFQDQLTFSQSSTLGVNIGTSYLSGFLSSELEKVLPFLINTDVSYVDSQDGSIAENADIRFTAAFGDAIVRFGGQLFKGISNTDFIVDYPLGKLLNSKTLSNNLVLRVERIYDPIDFSSSSSSSTISGSRVGAQIYYRIKF